MSKDNVKIEDMTQSPLEIELKGKKFKLSPIGLIDFGDFAEYIKSKKIALAEKIQDKDTRIEIIKQIMTEPVNTDQEFGTMAGAGYMTWKAIQKNHPEVELKDINNLIDLDNFEQVSIIISNLGGTVKNQQTAKVKSH